MDFWRRRFRTWKPLFLGLMLVFWGVSNSNSELSVMHRVFSSPKENKASNAAKELCKQQLALCVTGGDGEILDCTGVAWSQRWIRWKRFWLICVVSILLYISVYEFIFMCICMYRSVFS